MFAFTTRDTDGRRATRTHGMFLFCIFFAPSSISSGVGTNLNVATCGAALHFHDRETHSTACSFRTPSKFVLGVYMKSRTASSPQCSAAYPPEVAIRVAHVTNAVAPEHVLRLLHI